MTVSRQIRMLWLVVSLIPAMSHGGVWDWKTYTAMTQFNQLAVTDSLIWGATQGGITAFHPDKEEFTTWTNTEGLANNHVTAIAADDSGFLWIGFSDGLMQRFNPKKGTFTLFSDFAGYSISCFKPIHDTLFVGLEIGVSMYLIPRREVKETYRRLGTQLQTEIPVTDIVVSGRTLWIATDQGVAYALLTGINLLDPRSWTNLTTANGLPSNHVNALAAFQGSVYIGTDGGILRVTGSNREILNTGLSNTTIRSFGSDGGQLWVLTSTGVYQWNETAWKQFGSSLGSGLALSVYSDGQTFIGRSDGLIFWNAATQQWEKAVPNSPLENRFSDLAVDHDGVLWTCTSVSSGNGFSRFDGENWENYSKQNYPKMSSNNIGSVAVDIENNKWFGTFGGGAILLQADTVKTIFDVTNSLLVGYSGHESEPVIQDVVCESNGTVWFANFASYIGKPLVSFSLDGVWTNYGPADGISYLTLKQIMIDQSGRKWIGTEDNGILVFDDSGTPTDKSDDTFAGSLIGKSEGLESNKITSFAEEKDGTIWVGTALGLYTYHAGDAAATRVWWPSSDNIFALEIDGAKNIWVGHDAGISYRRNDDYTWHHFSIDNSPIPSNLVLSLKSDPETGKLYIGTADGLSVLETPFSEPRAEMQELRIYPNPFKPAEYQTVTIDELTGDVAVNIYSTAGFLVRQYPQNMVLGRRVLWDGLNDEGQSLPSGIYLVVEKSESGEKKIGKIALIR